MLASSAQMGGRAVAMYLFKDKMQRLRQYILEASKELEVILAGLVVEFCRAGGGFSSAGKGKWPAQCSSWGRGRRDQVFPGGLFSGTETFGAIYSINTSHRQQHDGVAPEPCLPPQLPSPRLQ